MESKSPALGAIMKSIDKARGELREAEIVAREKRAALDALEWAEASIANAESLAARAKKELE